MIRRLVNVCGGGCNVPVVTIIVMVMVMILIVMATPFIIIQTLMQYRFNEANLLVVKVEILFVMKFIISLVMKAEISLVMKARSLSMSDTKYNHDISLLVNTELV